MAGSNASPGKPAGPRPAGPRPAGPGTAQRAEPPYEVLKNAILHGDLGPGQPLVEASLAAWCNVSRTPVREALLRLEQDGLVSRTDRGLVVRERSPEEIIDLYETRMILEATVGRVAAERRTDHDIRTLRRHLSRGEDVDVADPRAMVAANQQFHRAVWRAAHNESLLDLLERLNLHLARYPETTLQFPGRWEQAWKEHAELIDAIEARASERAYEVALRHFKQARDIRLALFDQDFTD
jgi:DNA-binding GntR family transcriptional regulator